jgi:hypothetical protein
MWIILFNALDDFGIKEIHNRTFELNNPEVEEIKRKIVDEAIRGSTRIAGLVSVDLEAPSGSDWLNGDTTGGSSNREWVPGLFSPFHLHTNAAQSLARNWTQP